MPSLLTPSPHEAFLQPLSTLPLRHLDVAMARFVAQRDAQATVPLLLAVAWLAHLEGRGHTCLDLAAMHSQPAHELAWPVAHTATLSELHRHLPASLAAWVAAIAASPLVWVQEEGADVGQPLVLALAPVPRLYLRRYWRWEQAVAQALVARSVQPPRYQPATLKPWLSSLFPASGDAASDPDWQQLACVVALNAGLSIITGGPGTGKTYTAARVLVALLATAARPEQLRIALAAPTGKAAARLKQSIDSSLLALAPVVAPHLELAPLIERIGQATTLHRLLGAQGERRQWRHHAANPLPFDVVMVDEASMIHLEMMAALLAALPAHTQLMLLGDKDQLDSVEAGAVLGDLCREAAQGHYAADTQAALEAATGCELPPAFLHAADGSTAPPLAQQTVMLRRSRRFDGPIGELAQCVNVGDGASAAACLHRGSQGILQWHIQDSPDVAVKLAVRGRPLSGSPFAPALGYAAYAERVRRGPSSWAEHEAWVHQVLDAFEQVRVLCATRDGAWGVVGLNQAIAAELAQHGHLSLQGEWYAGRPVMVTRNDPDLGVFNGDIGMTLPAPQASKTTSVSHKAPTAAGPRWRVYFRDGATLRSVGAGRLAYVETAFALTVHKSQGSEFAHTLLVLPQAIGPLLNRPLVYTGITRAKTALTLITPHERVLHQALNTQASRHSGLRDALQHEAAKVA